MLGSYNLLEVICPAKLKLSFMAQIEGHWHYLSCSESVLGVGFPCSIIFFQFFKIIKIADTSFIFDRYQCS